MTLLAVVGYISVIIAIVARRATYFRLISV